MQILSNSLAPPGAEVARPMGGEKNQTLQSDSFKSVLRKDAPKGAEPLGVQKAQDRQVAKLPKRDSPPSAADKSAETKSRSENNVDAQKTEASKSEKAEPRTSKAKNTNGKSGAIQKFMDSLESELGITADRLTAVLAQLPPDVKALPVEESAGFVVEKLGIPSEQQPLVTEAYVNLLGKSGLTEPSMDSRSNGNIVYSQIGKPAFFDNDLALKAEQQIDLDNSAKLTPRQKLNVTIDELNHRFFDVKPKVADSSKTGPALDELSFEETRPNTFDRIPELANDYYGRLDQSIRPSLEAEVPMANRKSLNMGASSNLQGTETSIDSDLESILSLADIEGYSVQQPGSRAFEAASTGTENPLVNPSGKVKTWSVEELPFLAKGDLEQGNLLTKTLSQKEGDKGFEFGKTRLKGDLQNELENDAEMSDPFSNQFAVYNDREPSGQIEGNQLNRSYPAVAHGLTPNERAANIEKMTTATQGLANRGGGEVKVVLAPEGLGSVQLKVKLHEGRLQVELKAENRESQKILEQSLNSLRENLSAHRLSVDSVKVDVGGDFTRQESSQQQSFSQPQFDMGREQARQFMNMFREENLAQRQGAFEPTGFKTYRSRKEEALAPVSQEIRPRSSLSAGKGREINLVA